MIAKDRRISIRPVLILLLIIQISVVGGLIGWLSERNGRQSVEDLFSVFPSGAEAIQALG